MYKENQKEIDNFSKKLREIRKKKGISQEKMANDLFIDQSGLSKIERGIDRMSFEKYKKIKEYLDNDGELNYEDI